MDDEPWVRHWFNDDDTDAELDAAVNDVEPFVYHTRAELEEQLAHANATAKRLTGTVYYERAHRFINDILYDLEEIRGR